MRRGSSLRGAARRFGCSVRTAWVWVQRAAGQRLDRVDWADRPGGVRRGPGRTSRTVERRIVQARQRALHHGALGFHGPQALRQHLLQAGLRVVPSVRTISRILQRHGVGPTVRRRWPAPPAGWYLPAVAAGQAELDQLDFVEGLHLHGHGAVEVLTGISLWGKLAVAWPAAAWIIDSVCPVLQQHWRQQGAPAYLQLDNDTRFAGSSRAPRRLGRFIRFCLAQGVVPVFAPPRETGFQAAIESFNGLWQRKVWRRFRHRNLSALRRRSRQFLHALHAYHARLRDAAPARLTPCRPAQHAIFLRRTDARGRVTLLGVTVLVSRRWPHRLVRCELHLPSTRLRCFALRRREPSAQPLLRSCHFPLR